MIETRKHRLGGLKRAHRSGFTLVEILIVVTIILILAALILPAVNGVLRKANQATEIAELNQIAAALEQFKAKYGAYPPSRIRLRENTAGGSTAGYRVLGATPDVFDQHSVQWLERLWPQIQLRKDSGTAGSPTNVMPGHALGFEWFADGTTTTYELEGDECLVFFLGGIAQISGSDIVLHGFAHRPENPSGVPSSAIPDSQKRTQAFYTFDAGRLFVRTGTNVETLPTSEAEVDFATAATTRPAKLPSYRAKSSTDLSRPKPIAYFSSYDGTGYRPHDCNIPDPVSGPEYTHYNYQLVWNIGAPATTTTNISFPYSASSARTAGGLQHANSLGPNPYLVNDPFNPNTNDAAPVASTGFIKFYNEKTFQLIVPGRDGLYGRGGMLGNDDDSTEAGADNLSNVSESQTIGDFAKSRKGA